MLQAIEQPFLTTVREVLGPKYTAHLDRLYRKVIHFILSLLIVGFTQTTINSARQQLHHERGSFASSSSMAGVLAQRNNNNKDKTRRRSQRNSNCWTDGDCGAARTTT